MNQLVSFVLSVYICLLNELLDFLVLDSLSFQPQQDGAVGERCLQFTAFLHSLILLEELKLKLPNFGLFSHSQRCNCTFPCFANLLESFTFLFLCPLLRFSELRQLVIRFQYALESFQRMIFCLSLNRRDGLTWLVQRWHEGPPSFLHLVRQIRCAPLLNLNSLHFPVPS